MIFLVLYVVFTNKISATDSLVSNNCPPLSKALISPKHRIYKELNRYYYKFSRNYKSLRGSPDRRFLSSGSIWPDLNGKITNLIKVGDYGVANWTKEQYVAISFQKNQLALASTSMVGYYEEPCINCQDNDNAVDSLEKILPANANAKCIEKLYFENQHRLSSK